MHTQSPAVFGEVSGSGRMQSRVIELTLDTHASLVVIPPRANMLIPVSSGLACADQERQTHSDNISLAHATLCCQLLDERHLLGFERKRYTFSFHEHLLHCLSAFKFVLRLVCVVKYDRGAYAIPRHAFG